MLKRCKVVMLPTNQEATTGLQPFSLYAKPVTKRGLAIPTTGAYARRLQQLSFQAYHLYILDEEQQVGDFGLLKGANRVSIRTPDCGKAYDFQKVIATTDTSLNLPQPSQAFIEKYVDLYNKGQQIEEVNVEYELVGHSTTLGIENWEPKVSNNTITIRKIKHSYTREEVVLLLLDFGEFVLDNSILPNRKSVQEWLEKNL